MKISIEMKDITDTVFDVIQALNHGMSPVFAEMVAENVEKELNRKIESEQHKVVAD